MSAFTAFLPLFESEETNKYKPINVKVNYNTLKSDITYSMTNSIMGNPFELVLTGQKTDFNNSDLEVFAYKYSKITKTKVSFVFDNYMILYHIPVNCFQKDNYL